jgi:type VI secretion system protein ImpM
MPAEIVSADEPPGVYGKLPARGDFITRRLGRAFVNAWDDWLQQAILASQSALGPRWLDIYLTSPIWRFALGEGCLGPNTVIGVLMPSVDKVGRYFPLMLGRELEAAFELTGLAAHAAPWFEAVEHLALSTLTSEFSLDALEVPLALSLPVATSSPASPAATLAAPGIHIPLDAGADLAAAVGAQKPLAAGRTLWWTSGSALVTPCCLICPGAPRADAFASLLDGEWQLRGWIRVGPSDAGEQGALVTPDPG